MLNVCVCCCPLQDSDAAALGDDRRLRLNVTAHTLRTLDDYAYTCEQCSLGLMTLDMYVYHIEQHTVRRHRRVAPPPPQLMTSDELTKHVFRLQDDVFVCRCCSLYTRYHDAFLEHMRAHLVAAPFSCIHCEREFTTVNAFNVHFQGVLLHSDWVTTLTVGNCTWSGSLHCFARSYYRNCYVVYGHQNY